MALEYFDWEVGDVFVLHLQGPITLGQATQKLRELIQETVASGRTKILLNMAEVYYIDSSGLGELVAACTSAQRQGAQMKFMKLTPKVQDVMQLTRLFQVFDVYPDEDSAVSSFAVSTNDPAHPTP
jgi:anti-sigma B factor antagonist